MSDLRLNFPTRPPALVRQGGAPGHTRTLQNANREALNHLGWPMDATGDPKGRVLRQLRLQLGIDPSLLATQACMSLSQLYELEDGGNSRFYSDSLRRQAGRRVARLLGTDWDRLETDEKHKGSGTSNVVPLQRPMPAPNSNAPMTPEIVEVKVRVAPERSPSVTMVVNEPSITDTPEDQAISMGLATPASETLVVEPPETHYAATATKPVKKTSFWSTLWILVLVVGTGAASGYAFVEYSPYRLYWPW
jgi:hypothetical protein